MLSIIYLRMTDLVKKWPPREVVAPECLATRKTWASRLIEKWPLGSKSGPVEK